MKEYLTVREVEHQLDVSRVTINEMLKDGRLTGHKDTSVWPHQWRIDGESVYALINKKEKKLHTKLAKLREAKNWLFR